MVTLIEPENRCPHIIRKQAGDESIDICEINDKICLLVGDYECEIWEEIKREWAEEK